MSEEEKHFKRSEAGHDANALHNHGGQDARDEKSAREDLEDVIEALEEDEDIEETIPEETPVAKEGIKGEIPSHHDDFAFAAKDPIDEPIAKPIEPIPQKPAIEPTPEPENDWRAKPENQPFMTIDSVEEPKQEKKSRNTGLKILACLFLLLAIAGCSATAYIFFQNGSIEVLGRRITTADAKKEVPTTNCATPEKPVEPTKPDEEAVSIKDGKLTIAKWGVVLDMKESQFVDYKLESIQNSEEEMLKLWIIDPINAATITSKPAVADSTKNTQGMVVLYYRETLDTSEAGSKPELVYAIPNGGGYIYYDIVHKDFYGNYVTEDKELNLKIESGAIDYLFQTVLKTENFSPVE